MKKCKNCGMIQSDDNTVCLDCSSPLGSSLTETENQMAEDALKSKVHDLAEKTDEFYVPRHAKIMGYSCFLLIVIAVLLIAFAYTELGTLEAQRITEMNGVTLPDSFDLTIPTERMTQLSDAMACGWIAILTSAISVAFLLFPRLMWLLQTWKFRIFLDWETPASRFIMISRRISAYILYACSVFFLIYGWLLYL